MMKSDISAGKGGYGMDVTLENKIEMLSQDERNEVERYITLLMEKRPKDAANNKKRRH